MFEDSCKLPATFFTENRAGKPWSFMPGMNRRSFEGGGDGWEPGAAALWRGRVKSNENVTEEG